MEHQTDEKTYERFQSNRVVTNGKRAKKNATNGIDVVGGLWDVNGIRNVGSNKEKARQRESL